MPETEKDAALVGLVAVLADNKVFLGRRYAEWCTAAPTLESAVAAAAMAQDEIGHARSFYPLLRDLAGSSPETEAETRTQWTNTAFLNSSFSGWTDFVAANFLFDTALSVLLEAASASSFSPLAQRARRILEEEPLHWLHGEGWTRRLASKGTGVREALTASLAQVAPESLGLLACSSDDLVKRAVLSKGPDDLYSDFRTRVNPVLEEAGLPQV
jgi:phenylacetate-CoA oxygenase PaaI subunit